LNIGSSYIINQNIKVLLIKMIN